MTTPPSAAAAAPLHPALVCPDCRGILRPDADRTVTCTSCERTFPRATGGVPVLLPTDSAFDVAKIAAGSDTYHAHRASESKRKQRFRRKLPGLASDLQSNAADQLVNRLIHRLLVAEAAGPEPVVGPADAPGGPHLSADGLVIGAGFRVEEYSRRFPEVRWLVTDVEATFGAAVVGDVTALPVADATQDFVLCEHVLEHVLDPLAAAREIERVLRPGGIALVKVPFNYPWHGGFIDFYRFTPAGYLAAFRHLEAVHIGHGPGPASTVNYAINQAWVSLFSRRITRRAAVVVGRLVLGPWRRLDAVFITRTGSLSSGASLIFIGRRVERYRTSTEVVAEAKALGTAPPRHPDDIEP